MGKATISSHIDDGLYSAETKWRDDYGNTEKEMWCADYSVSPYPELSGDVGTIEIPNEPEEQMIRPGYDGRAAYDASRDGRLAKPEILTPEEFFYNLAMMPGWQKWMPTYRLGVVQEVSDQNYNEGVLPIIITDPNVSSQQNIDVEPEADIALIQAEYMECDAYAFEEGDEVVIEYSPVLGGGFPARNTITYSPKVIGFKSSPKQCGLIEYWWGPSRTEKNAWIARAQEFGVSEEIQSPWVSDINVLGNKVEFTGPPSDTISGNFYIERSDPAGGTARRSYIRYDYPKPYKIKKGEVKLIVSEYSPSFSTNTGLPIDIISISLYDDRHPATGSDIWVGKIETTGEIVFDISEHIGKEIYHAWISDGGAYWASANAALGTYARIEKISVL